MLLYEELLNASLGAVCEVRSLRNDLLFVGRLEEFDGTSAVVAASNPVPPVLYNTEIKLVLYVPQRGRVEVRAAVRGSSESFWKLDRFFLLQEAEDQRQHFRQRLSCQCEVLHVEETGVGDPKPPSKREAIEFFPGVVMDISQGGVRLACRGRFLPGSWLRLTGLHLPCGPTPFAPVCRVQWSDEAVPESLYGCSFTDLTPREQEQVTRSVLRLQQLDLQTHRS